MSRIKAIVAVDPNFAIGRGGTLPWHYSADLKFFKRTTTGHVVVMGRATFESIGKPLPNRRNIVLSASGFDAAGTTTLRSVEEVLNLVRSIDHESIVFVIGGARVYQALAPFIDEWLVTRIPVAVPDADTFLPRSLFDGFSVESSEDLGEGLQVDRLIRR